MGYYVVTDDGSRYGPTDLEGLNRWAKEGRLSASSRVEEDETGIVVEARVLPGLVFGSEPPAKPTHEGYYRMPNSVQAQGGAAGQSDVTAAWVLGAVTFAFCCPVLPGLGLYFANKAVSAGNPGGNAAKVFNTVVLALSCLLYLGYGVVVIVALVAGASSGARF